MARTALTVPSAYTPDGVKANYDSNIAAANDNFEELYGVETQTITTTPATITMPIVVLAYATGGAKVVKLPAVANTTLRRINVTKTVGVTSTATVSPQTGEYLDGVVNGTLAMTDLGLSVTFQVIDGKWVSDWVGKNAGAPDGQTVNFKPGGTDKSLVFQTDVAAGGKLKVVDTTTGITDEYPATWIQANRIELGLGTSYIGAVLSGRSDGALVLTSGNDKCHLAADTGENVVLEVDAGQNVQLITGTYKATLTADTDSKLVSTSGFSGDGSALTGIVDSALSSNVPLLNAANAYTNVASYQPGAAYDTAALGEEILDATTWTVPAGWAYVSGTDWTQGFTHSGAITAVNATPTNGGTGYTLNDVLTVTTGDGTATVTATGVSGGVVTAVTLTSGGTAGYRGGTGQATSGGTGNGCTVNVTAIAGGTETLKHSDTPTIGANYHIAFTVSDYVGSGYFTVTYGGLTTISQYGSGTFGVKAVTATGLSIAPSTNFSGTIVISIKPVTAYSPAYTLKDGSGGIVVEGRSSVSSLQNQYVGYGSGQLTTTGNGNTAFGYSALETVSTGTTNTAVGTFALQTLSGGLANTAVGYNAGLRITSGIQNLLLGASSGMNLTSGRYNVAIGPAALGSASTTSFNVALGYLSSSAVTGANNVSIGGYSLKSATGSGNISIGHYSGGYATGSNEFYVNNKDQTNTATEKANSLLYGVMGATAASQTLAVNGKLKIDPSAAGYVAPTEALDVTGNIKASGTIAATGTVTSNSYPLARWRGGGTTDPSTNLVDGDLFYNTTTSELKVYYNSAWRTAAPPAP